MEHRFATPPPVQARRVIVSFSPHAGAQATDRRAADIGRELEHRGFRVQLTSELAELRSTAAEWHKSGELRAIVACGGDGTAAFVRNHTPLEAPLLVVPLGTENLLGRYLKQPPSVAAVVVTVEQGVVVEFDLGLARGGANVASQRYFLLMASAGFDAEVVRRLHHRRSGHITRLSYLQPVLEAIRSYEYPELQLYCLDESPQGGEPLCCRWAFAFNLPLYARGWQFAPDAAGTNGRFEVCTFENGSLLHGLRYLWHVMRETHQNLKDAQITGGKRFRIESDDANDVPYQLDGDFAGILPLEIEVLPRQLRMLVMPEVAERLGFVRQAFQPDMH